MGDLSVFESAGPERGGFLRDFSWGEPEEIPEEVVYLDMASRVGAAPRSFHYLDCGAWGGDQRSDRQARSFAVACGGAVALCEFTPGMPYGGLSLSASNGASAMDRLLRVLAGPQKNDVQVRRAMESPAGDAPADKVYLLLPSLHFPIATRMPQHAPDLIPDPTIMRCFCHGPILRRLMFGTKVEARYQAIGCALGRDPNEWFYAMADTYRDAADDLVKLLSRLQRFRGKERLHLVQLGDPFEVWTGFGCCYQSSGRAAMVVPRALTGLDPSELFRRWRSVAVDTPILRAIERLCSAPGVDRTWLHGERALAPAYPGESTPAAPERPSAVDVPGLLFAERPPVPSNAERAPFGLFDLLRQQSVFNARQRARPTRGRGAIAERSVRLYLDREGSAGEGRAPFPLYVCGHTGSACLTRISVVGALGG